MAVLSFHPAKHVTSGEGGAVLVDDYALYQRLCAFRNCGRTFAGDPDIYFPGLNLHITEMGAAMLLGQLMGTRLYQKREKLNWIANTYKNAFSSDSRVVLPTFHKNHSWHLFPIRLTSFVKKHRDQVRSELTRLGVGTQVHYKPIHLQPAHRQDISLPVAEMAWQRLISLPCYASMTEEDVDYVINSLRGVLSGAAV